MHVNTTGAHVHGLQALDIDERMKAKRNRHRPKADERYKLSHEAKRDTGSYL